MKSYGEGFQQPQDILTGKPIPGEPEVALTGGQRGQTTGIIYLRPEGNTTTDGRPDPDPTIDQPRVPYATPKGF